MKLPSKPDISAFVSLCLAEDIGDGDLTAKLIPADSAVEAKIISRAEGIICGTAWVDEVFRQLDPEIRPTSVCHDHSWLTVLIACKYAARVAELNLL